MPINDDYVPVQLEANGVLTDFDFDFKVYATTDVKVSLVVRATGVTTEQTINTDYTVVLDEVNGGGTVTFLSAPADTYDVLIESDIPNVQPFNLSALGTFNQAQLITALDRQCRLVQQVSERANRGLAAPVTGSLTDLELPTPEADKVLGWNSDGDGLENKVALDEDSVTACSNAQTAAQAAQVLAEAAQAAAEAAQVAAEEAAAEAELVAGIEVASQAEAEAGTDNAKMMTPLRTAQAIAAQIMGLVYPVGSIVTLGVSTNPATLFGIGTWTAIAGKVIVGIDAGQTEFDTLNETGGAKTVTLTAAQSGLPAHTHALSVGTNDSGSAIQSIDANATPSGATVTGAISGGAQSASEAHTNLQPYIVKYVWQRTA